MGGRNACPKKSADFGKHESKRATWQVRPRTNIARKCFITTRLLSRDGPGALSGIPRSNQRVEVNALHPGGGSLNPEMTWLGTSGASATLSLHLHHMKSDHLPAATDETLPL
jgi:hypothetical protein